MTHSAPELHALRARGRLVCPPCSLSSGYPERGARGRLVCPPCSLSSVNPRRGARGRLVCPPCSLSSAVAVSEGCIGCQEMGKIPNFTDSERMKTPKTDCALKVYKDKEFYQLGFQVC